MPDFNVFIKGKICPYCNCSTELVDHTAIYGLSSTFGGKYFRCVKNNDHYVGTYKNTSKSLGRLADKELRIWKMKGHTEFDALWREEPKRFKERYNAYQWLSKEMGINMAHTHFGMFDIEQCKTAIEICKKIKDVYTNE